jgi:hypothetical protein
MQIVNKLEMMLGKSKFVFKPHGNEFCVEQCMGKTHS